jgi:hypothetical protein
MQKRGGLFVLPFTSRVEGCRKQYVELHLQLRKKSGIFIMTPEEIWLASLKFGQLHRQYYGYIIDGSPFTTLEEIVDLSFGLKKKFS